MKPAWHFNKVHPRFKNRESTQGEFFTSDTPLRSFVREAVQNSLDARRPDVTGPVQVRIFISGDLHALPPDTAKKYFRGGWEHFCSDSSGLREIPDAGEPCRFAAYEDVGTTGLIGDPEQFHEIPEHRNPFYYFFRAEGQSNKGADGRGRWGLGKYVFPRSSRIRTFFGLTVRCDDHRRLLVGQSILRSHQAKGRNYTPDGWFGRKPSGDHPPRPIEDSRFIDEFARDFCLERRAEPGLSIVIPFCDPSWDAISVANCVVQDYFSAVLLDELVVTVEDPGGIFVIQSHSLAEILKSCHPTVAQQVRPLLELTVWGRGCQESDDLVRFSEWPALEPGQGASRSTSVDVRAVQRLRHLYRTEGRAAVRIPIHLRPRNDDVLSTFLDVFIARSPAETSGRPVFVRQGIVISGVRSERLQNAFAIVHISDPPLAGFLGDAENPAHTDWSAESGRFRDRYEQGAETLRLVTSAATRLFQLLDESACSDESDLLLDIFSIRDTGDQQARSVRFETHSSLEPSAAQSLRKLAHIRTEPSAARKPFRVTRRKGGFRITGHPSADVLAHPAGSAYIEIRVAYDRRQGSPLRKYCEADFHLKESPIHIDSSGAEARVCGPNLLRLFPLNGTFEVTVSGFDVNRDLYVSTRLRQADETAD